MDKKKMSKPVYIALIIITIVLSLVKGGMTLSKAEDRIEEEKEKNSPKGGVTVSTYVVTSSGAEAETETGTDADTTDQLALTTRPEEYVTYTFRSKKRLEEHYEKHGREMGFATAEDYERRACDIINDPDTLFKVEREDGDGVYYVESTDEFVILSTDGYIRTYYICSGRDYFDRQ